MHTFYTLICLCFVCGSLAINRPVYKVVLTQKGYVQSLQYDVETPPLREFTFCTWIRIYDRRGDQTIFSYLANGNNRLLRLWLDIEAREIKVSIDRRVYSSSAVDIATDTWHHMCFSYQSDFGAWALYLDGRVISCEASQYIEGYIIPGGGTIILGYGTSDNGTQNGFEGEIFGASMILVSTIEGNHTIRIHAPFMQRPFNNNWIRPRNKNNMKYIVLGDIDGDDIKNTFETRPKIELYNNINNKEFAKDIIKNINTKRKNVKTIDEQNKKEKDLSSLSTPDINIHFKSDNSHIRRFKTRSKNSGLFEAETKNLPEVFEYETPPLPNAPKQNYANDNFEIETLPEFDEENMSRELVTSHKSVMYELSDTETPPTPHLDPKVYGQWVSSKFAGNVLNYLRTINFTKKNLNRVPATLPLQKITDAFPYQSEVKVNRLHPPFQIQRKNFRTVKREINDKQINVEIIEDDLRSNIIRLHRETMPQSVEVTSRGEAKPHVELRFYRNLDSQHANGSVKKNAKPDRMKNHKPKQLSAIESAKSNSLVSILPFLKSIEYYVKDKMKTEKHEHSHKMYTKTLSHGNKWHNTKTYGSDHTPRRISLSSPTDGTKLNIDYKVQEANKGLSTLRLQNKKPNQPTAESKSHQNIIKGIALAKEVSGNQESPSDSVSLIKYNHGYLPGHETKKSIPIPDQENKRKNVNNFDKKVKIGNALNEKYLIGEQVNKNSFIGGDETVPDINRYRSQKDHTYRDVPIGIPSSLGPKVCKNMELVDRLLYVQPDGGIDMTHILSPIKQKNIAVDFITDNYKKCSLAESAIAKSPLLLIDWNKTPVHLFGGAYPQITTDLCGFF